MSAIDELKAGAENSTGKQINLNNLTNNGSSGRKPITIDHAIEINAVEDDSPAEPTQTYVESILDTENPNSMFMQHVKEKTAEAQEWIAEQEEKRAMEEESATDESEDDEDGLVIDTTSDAEEEEDTDEVRMTAGDTSNMEIVDIMGNSDNEDDEEESDEDDDEPVDIDDEEESEEEEDDTDEELYESDDEETVEKAVESKTEEQHQSFTAPEIDIEMTESEDADVPVDDDDDDNDITPIDSIPEGEDVDVDRLRQIATERLNPASLNLDLSSFTVLQKPKVNSSDVFASYKAKISKWVLMNQKCTVLMKEFSGAELETLMEYYRASARSIDALRRMLNMIYDHIVSAKPSNFETWLKVTPDSDIDNYFFAIYISSFNGANYIPIDCNGDGCGKSYVTDDIGIMDGMVKFDTEEKKKEFTEIYNSEVPPQSKGVYVTEIVPLSYKVAISFKEPSLWDRIQLNSISDDVTNKFASIIALIPYIDNLYSIDMETKKLTPIGYKTFTDNKVKTTESRIRKYNSIFSSLTVDEFAPVKAYVNAIMDKSSRGIDYVIPETTCPECGHVNEETPIPQGSVADMVFTRCQLGALTNTSIN